ncbi:MAG: NYN domain-containing protein [Eubacteriales bacterium]|nr:NYN domain-containing protein [Eubacteriales bacterium]
MKKEYLLVDGYNIIFAWDNLKKMADYSLEEAREKLISILSNYQGAKGIELIIVFDAHLVKGNRGNIEKRGKTYIVYTKEAETADNYIESITKSLVKDYNVKVATSDRLEQIIIMGKGAIRVSATELKADVKYTAKKVSKKIEEIKPIKNNMLFDNLDPEMAKWVEEMRRKKD